MRRVRGTEDVKKLAGLPLLALYFGKVTLLHSNAQRSPRTAVPESCHFNGRALVPYFGDPCQGLMGSRAEAKIYTLLVRVLLIH
jgi:hypothetical protein